MRKFFTDLELDVFPGNDILCSEKGEGSLKWHH